MGDGRFKKMEEKINTKNMEECKPEIKSRDCAFLKKKLRCFNGEIKSNIGGKNCIRPAHSPCKDSKEYSELI